MINLTIATQAVLEELSRMRSEGVDRIFVQNQTLKELGSLLSANSEIENNYDPEDGVTQSNRSTQKSDYLAVEEPKPKDVQSPAKIKNVAPSIVCFIDASRILSEVNLLSKSASNPAVILITKATIKEVVVELL